MVNPEHYDHIPEYDQYKNDGRNYATSSGTSLVVSSYSDVGLVKISEVQHIDSTGYIAELDMVKTSNAEFDGYVLNENNERQEVKVHAFAPVQDTQFLERELQEATGGIHFFYNDGMPVYAQGGNSWAGVKVKNPRTGSYDIMEVLSAQGGILYSKESLDPYAITPKMSQIDKYYSEYDPSYIPNDDSWTRLEEYVDPDTDTDTDTNPDIDDNVDTGENTSSNNGLPASGSGSMGLWSLLDLGYILRRRYIEDK